MWVVVKIGSHQYKVKEQDVISTERLNKSQGAKIVLDKVLLAADKDNLSLGRPYLKNIKIDAEVIDEKKAKKIIIFKYKRRKQYQRTQGHRQIHTRLKILKIKKTK